MFPVEAPGHNYHSAMTHLKNDVLLRQRATMHPLQASDNIIDEYTTDLQQKHDNFVVSSDSEKSEDSRQ